MEILPGVAEAIALLNRAGLCVIVVSNQRCVAKGLITIADLEVLHERMCSVLASAGATIDAVYYCPHEKEPPCRCRKPQPGMLLEAAHEHDVDLHASWMIGDAKADVDAGRSVGSKTALIVGSHESTKLEPDMVAASLLDAAQLILQLEEGVADQRSYSKHRVRI
jgi:histidinol-phosphate phosphatase family protein